MANEILVLVVAIAGIYFVYKRGQYLKNKKMKKKPQDWEYFLNLNPDDPLMVARANIQRNAWDGHGVSYEEQVFYGDQYSLQPSDV